jgi:hypothetical protein
VLKPEADLLELMRANRQVQNKREAEQAAVDLETTRESLLAVRIERVAPHATQDRWLIRGYGPAGRSECQAYRDKRPRFSGGRKRPAIAVPSRARATTSRLYGRRDYIADAVMHLQGKEDVDALLADTTPLTWEHIGFSGDFLRDRAAATASKRRPINLRHMRKAA